MTSVCPRGPRFASVRRVKLATFLAPGAPGPQAGEVCEEDVYACTDGDSVLDRLASGEIESLGAIEHAVA